MIFKRKVILCGVLLLSVGLLAGICMSVRTSIHQEELDRALIVAIKGQNARQVIALLDSGANPNVIDKRGDTINIKQLWTGLWDRLKGTLPPPKPYYPTAFALSFDRNLWQVGTTKDNVWAAFLRHHANPLTKDENGSTLLAYAAMDNHAPTVRLLMALHIDPNLKDYCGNAPVIYTDYECARILLENGANPNCRGACGVTPLIGTAMNQFETGQLLLDRQADINAQNQDGQTSLMLAFIHHKYDFTGATALLNHGPRVTIQDKFGKTALDYARKRKVKALVARMEATARQENLTAE